MNTDFLFYFIFLALLAEIAGTVGGFGSSLFFVPIAGYFFDFYSVLGITAIFHLSSNISKIALFRKGFDKKLVLRIGLPAVIFVIIGAFLSKFMDTLLLDVLLAVFLILTSVTFLIFRNFALKPSLTSAIGGGALSGITAGILGTGGAIRGLTLTAFHLGKDVFIATSAWIDLGIDFSRSIVYYANGFIHKHDLYLVPILMAVSIAGTWAGKMLLNHFSEKQFRNIVLALILAIGITTLMKHIF